MGTPASLHTLEQRARAAEVEATRLRAELHSAARAERQLHAEMTRAELTRRTEKRLRAVWSTSTYSWLPMEVGRRNGADATEPQPERMSLREWLTSSRDGRDSSWRSQLQQQQKPESVSRSMAVWLM